GWVDGWTRSIARLFLSRKLQQIKQGSLRGPPLQETMQIVESRKGAGAWAIRQRSVSLPRSSNRTCGFPASGFPTDFTAGPRGASERACGGGGERRGLHRRG